MRATVPILAVAVFSALAAAGCGDDNAPTPATCELSTDTLAFEPLLPPQFAGTPKKSVRKLTVTNDLNTVDSGGNADLVGTLVVHVDSKTDVPPVVRSVGADPSFRIPPRNSVTWDIEAIVDNKTSPGFYLGEVDLGSGCRRIPFSILVQGRAEPPPNFLHMWGRRGPAPGEFEKPAGIAVDRSGNVYVLDSGNDDVQRFSADGEPQGRWTQWWEWMEAKPDSFPTHFLTPGGIAVDREGYVYVSDREPEHKRDRITKFNTDGTAADRYGPNQGGSSILRPYHLGVDDEGRVFFIELDRNRVSVVQRVGDEWIQQGSWTFSAWPRMVPWGLAVSPLGFVYVSDWFNNRILKFSKDGEFLLQWGGKGSGLGKFDGPAGLAVDDAGSVYVVDSGNGRIQKFNPNGAPLTEWGTPGTFGAQFSEPNAVSVGADGLIYVADSGNRRIQVFAPSEVPPVQP